MHIQIPWELNGLRFGSTRGRLIQMLQLGMSVFRCIVKCLGALLGYGPRVIMEGQFRLPVRAICVLQSSTVAAQQTVHYVCTHKHVLEGCGGCVNRPNTARIYNTANREYMSKGDALMFNTLDVDDLFLCAASSSTKS